MVSLKNGFKFIVGMSLSATVAAFSVVSQVNAQMSDQAF